MKQFLLDTDICIFFLKNKFFISEKIKSVKISNCYISEITIAELIYGAKKSQNYFKHISEVKKIESIFNILPIYDNFTKYADEKVRLQFNGELIPDFDLLIGTTAIQQELILVTNNEKHFNRLNNLTIENWTKKIFNNFIP